MVLLNCDLGLLKKQSLQPSSIVASIGAYVGDRSLKAHGVSHVRIPVGWWIMDPPVDVPPRILEG